MVQGTPEDLTIKYKNNWQQLSKKDLSKRGVNFDIAFENKMTNNTRKRNRLI